MGGGPGADTDAAEVAAAEAAVSAAAAAVAAAASAVVQGASELERWLLEQVVAGAMDDMETYVRDAIEEQAEEESWLADVARGRREERAREAEGDSGAEEGAVVGGDQVEEAAEEVVDVEQED